MKSCIRELGGNVVLRSGDFAMRFFKDYGGAPLEFWRDTFPGPITNSFPGSGCQVNWDNGQDPTQASANGLLKNTIKTLQLGDSTTDYYVKEFLIDGAGSYGVCGKLFDFILSSEWNDDVIAPNNNGSDSGWYTKYNPGIFGYEAQLNSPECPIIFQGSSSNFSGMFFVGDELNGNEPWNDRLRNYGTGRIAFKTGISLQHAATTAYAGFCFRKKISFPFPASKDDAYHATGLHLFFYKSGLWNLTEVRSGLQHVLYSGKLPASAKKALATYKGLQVEVRTYIQSPEVVDIFLAGIPFIRAVVPADIQGPHFCWFAQTDSGYIQFNDRQVCHTGVEFSTTFTALEDGKIAANYEIKKSIGVTEPVSFYRTGIPQIFLNKDVFPLGERSAQGFRNGQWMDIDGIYLFNDFDKFYIGNKEGTCGVSAKVLSVEIDGETPVEPHVLISKDQINDEFVLHFNALPPYQRKEFSKCNIFIEFQNHK